MKLTQGNETIDVKVGDGATIKYYSDCRADHNMYTDNGVSKYGNYGTRLLFGFREEYFDYSF